MNDVKPSVIGLQGCSEEFQAEVGEKAFGLYNLMRAGAAVPSGFCITISAFRDFLHHDDKLEHLTQLLEGEFEEHKDAGNLRELSGKVHQGILETSLDANLSNQIMEAYRKLVAADNRPVAIRSSTTLEDAGVADRADQHGTFLNISSEADLFGTIKKVWANCCVGIATSHGISPGLGPSSNVAVIIQSMVNARASGVVFTVNPLTMDRSIVLIEAVRGTGEGFVSGDATHDQYSVNKVTLEIEKTVLPHKTDASKPCLSHAEINHLVGMGRSVEKYLRRPQEIRWVAEGPDEDRESNSRLFFVRSRPIPFPEKIKSITSSDMFSFITSTVNKRIKVS